MRPFRRAPFDVFDNPVLVGTVTILTVIVAVFLSYIAENGLPFIPTYTVNVQVADAAELVKNADVRIGGARVGQVLTITPEAANRQWGRPYAQLGLALQRSLKPLPTDTRYQVRLASVLGGKYVELIPGNHGVVNRPGLPDGATLTLNRNPKLNHNIPFVDLDTAFATFGPRTQAGIRSATAQLAGAVAGRGSDFNDAIYNTRALIGPLERLLALLSSSTTHLRGFISGLAATTGALAPVAPRIGSLLSGGATTFRALDRSAVGATIDQLPPTESLGAAVLRNALPVLSDAAAIAQDLRPGARLLLRVSRRLDSVLRTAPPVFRQLPPVADALSSALAQVRKVAQDPASTRVFKVLGTNDLGTEGASAFVGIGAILNAIAPAQFSCNVGGLWSSNLASSLSEGNSTAAWLRFMPIIDSSALIQSGAPSANLHQNYHPIENARQCEAGNERYSAVEKLGNPGHTSRAVDTTAPPAGVLARGRRAGLVP